MIVKILVAEKSIILGMDRLFCRLITVVTDTHTTTSGVLFHGISVCPEPESPSRPAMASYGIPPSSELQPIKSCGTYLSRMFGIRITASDLGSLPPKSAVPGARIVLILTDRGWARA